MARLIALAAALLVSVSVLVVTAEPVSAAEGDEIYPIVFPVVGRVYYSDTFGACRGTGCSRTHEGIDIMTYGLKGVPVVAAHDGVVVRTSTALGRECCAIWGLQADDGWETWYIHLNNDSVGTDDGEGWGFAPGIEPGARVTAGQLIGWVGDSGNAEGTGPHLHFELHKPDGTVINAYESLLAATPVDLPRIWGADRFVTAAQIASDGFPEGSDTVFVTTGYAFPDALSVGAVSAANNLPVLLTNTDSLPSATRSAIASLNPSTIVVVGGPAAVSPSVFADLESLAPSTVRIGGVDRYDTARLVAEQYFADTPIAYVANGYSFPEAVSGGVAAGITDGPLLLTNGSQLSRSTAEYLSSLPEVFVVVVGDSDSVDAVVEQEIEAIPSVMGTMRISAGGASEISIAVSQEVFPNGAGRVYLATGGDYADALAGASLAGIEGAPILLLTDGGLDAVVAETARLGAPEIVVLGGPAAVGYDWILPFWNEASGNTMPTWNSHG